jgi:arabinofuranosyltransferase
MGSKLRPSATLTALRVLAVALTAVAVLRTAWISDDALITLRTALNITHGWGPGFNATEAVQAYTHPLWFLLWIGVGVATNQWILGILALSAVCTAAAVGILVWRTRSAPRIIVAAGLLLLSNAFIEYATSGLENPLAYLLLGALLTVSFRTRWSDVATGSRWQRIGYPVSAGLLIAAVFLTRMDLLLLIAPAVVLLVIRNRHHLRTILIAIAAAILPILVWFTWSWVTYATFLPNTFLAKRNVDIPATELVVQGLRYLWVSFEHDPVTLVAIVIGLTVALATRNTTGRVWAVGVLLYLGYLTWIGGDFMAGRFLAVPVYVSVFLIVAVTTIPVEREPIDELHPASTAVAVGLVTVLLVATVAAGMPSTSIANPQMARWEVDQNINAGVSDERGVYVANDRSLKGLVDNLSLAFLTPNIVPIGDGSGLNRSLRDLDKESKEWPDRPADFSQPSEVGVFCGFLGTVGMATGPITHLIDPCALTDRYLAAHPYAPASPFAWKPGHFERPIPPGYVEAVQSGDPSRVEDPRDEFQLKELWRRIRPTESVTVPGATP